MDWDCEILKEAMLEWFLEEIKTRGWDKNYAALGRRLQWTKIDDNGRTLRRLVNEKGKRDWTLVDICKIANVLEEQPSYILAKIELFYKINKKNLSVKLRKIKVPQLNPAKKT